MFGLGNKKADFHRRMRQVAVGNRYQVLEQDDDGWMVEVPTPDHGYWVIAILNGSDVLVRSLSRYLFPPRQLPSDIGDAVLRMNRTIPDCDYGGHHGKKGSRFCVTTKIRLSNLAPDSFRAAVHTIVARSMALDKHLEDEGYAR